MAHGPWPMAHGPTTQKLAKQKTINTAKQIKCYFYFVSSNGNSKYQIAITRQPKYLCLT
jgi:hypothetical protein